MLVHVLVSFGSNAVAELFGTEHLNDTFGELGWGIAEEKLFVRGGTEGGIGQRGGDAGHLHRHGFEKLVLQAAT